MAKYSILVAAYQCEDSIDRCLTSIFAQTLSDYQVLVLNDGSTDHTLEKLKRYEERITLLCHLQNEGISRTRNDLIEACSSDYFTFVDSDDYLEPNFLEQVDSYCDQTTEVVSFSMDLVDSDRKFLSSWIKPAMDKQSGQAILTEWIKAGVTFDTPVGYLYLTSYFKDNGFVYAVGHRHEDFGLTPLTILKASQMVSLSKVFYHYVQTPSSITRGIDADQRVQSAMDMLFHYDFLKQEVQQDTEILDKTKIYFFSYLANSVLSRLSTLDPKDQGWYKEELRQRSMSSDLLADTWKRKIKKIWWTHRLGGKR